MTWSQTPSGLFLPGYHEEALVEMPSGLLVSQDFAREKAMAERRITGVDVFCGCGGFSLGAIQAGIEVVAGIEKWADAIITYMANLCRWGQVKFHFIEESDESAMEKALQKRFKRDKKNKDQIELLLAGSGWIANQPESTPGVSHMIVGDVRKLTGKKLLEVVGLEFGELGCMFGGPPCQGFTYANSKRGPDNHSNDLVFEFARLIVETNPQTIIMENVPGILTMKTPEGHNVVARFCQILRDGGFHGVDAFQESVSKYGRAGAINPKQNAKDRKGKRAKKK